VALIAGIVALEHHLKHHHGEMLTHPVRRSVPAKVAVFVTAVHLMDTKGRLRRWDPISFLGRLL
jgi:Ca2+/Na+ antiporter